MKIVLFHIRTRQDIDEVAYETAFEQMYALVSQVPGFAGLETFPNTDGDELAVARFENDESLRQWRELPEHVATQHRARAEFFEAYRITVTDLDREYGWSRSPDRS